MFINQVPFFSLNLSKYLYLYFDCSIQYFDASTSYIHNFSCNRACKYSSKKFITSMLNVLFVIKTCKGSDQVMKYNSAEVYYVI